MALDKCAIIHRKRSNNESAVSAAAYQSGEKLFSEYDQEQKYSPYKTEVTHKEIMLPPHAPPEFADRNTLWNSLWHNKSPHLFFSMPYCLTNGVQFRRAAPYGVWGRLATNKQGRVGYAGSLLAATTDTWIVIVPCFELDRINSRRYLSFFAQIN